MKKYTGIIYMYESPSGKYYIEQTTRPKSRKNEHASMSYNNSENHVLVKSVKVDHVLNYLLIM